MNPLIRSFESSTEGQLIQLGDVDLLIELDTKAPRTLPSFLIKSKETFRDGQTKIYKLTLDHVGSELEYILIGESFGVFMDVKLFNKPDFFNPNRRDVLFNGDFGWLFDFDAYPAEIYDGDSNAFIRNGNRPEVFDSTAIIEWKTEEKIINYLLMLVETGIHNETGGWVEFFEGRQIRDEDVSF